MYYELYIDIFFLVNFIMDICILFVTRKILKCPSTYGNILMGAFLGALLTCLVVFMPVTYRIIKIILFHGPVCSLMIKTGLKVKGKKSFVKAYAALYGVSFLTGGICLSFRQYIREGIVFFGIAMLSSILAMGIWELLLYLGKSRKIQCEALLINKGNQRKVRAIIDTGNRLRDNLTGKPVSIISSKVARELWQDFPEKGLRYIPFHTIGKKDGVLPVFTLEKICLHLEEETWKKQILIAVSTELDETGVYDMILNPDIL